MNTFKPIRYDQRQVTLMLEIASLLRGKRTSLEALGLQKDGDGYIWNPR